ncbi:Fucoxanthin-chlorophyll a-c binding protein [Seminavis robusta]|uniref:Fucoxanthin-chlorophyll a-c binding protein n=1 Tax=Seminavis robusta TaxID=568900 RepID=A0A9N8DK12_9STRA|nr:Fucoxanthin-chlorophyll a-c binding protein [Seminavis robusta]|eukprot:Sro101_g051590.1 Fucoxanthin-chlorophyll a-c binding protein (202) ;mRNA; r:51146-51844
MMKACILSTLLASAAAFSPAAQPAKASTTALSAMSDYRGSINLLGKETVFDPLKLSESYEPMLPFFREAELRHGRTAMIACVGMIVQDIVRLPGDAFSFETVPKSVDAAFSMPDQMNQIFLFVGLWEFVVAFPAIAAMNKGERAPGDYGMAAFLESGNNPPTAARVASMEDSELLNGRLAMIAFMGMFHQSLIFDKSAPFI